METHTMDIPLELSFHNLEPSDTLKSAVQEHVDRLEQFHDHIIGCRVSIEMPHKSQKARGNQPDVHIVIRVPGKEIVVSKELAHAGHKKSATDAYAVLDNAFAVAASRLKDFRHISHGEVKYKSGEPRGAPERNQAFRGSSS
ncbi:MAG: ribosome-associated translation inhibitor RaiA [Alphaproteobacteria bacterium]|nr:ribosome-associated translation inhibitor RaiA [Alphaproteobacteria bacterium]